MGKKILIMRGDCELTSSPNEICINRNLEVLNQRGYETATITYRNSSSQLMEDFQDGTNVYRVKPRLSVRYILKYKENPTAFNKIISKIANLVSRFEGALYGKWWPLLDPIAVLRYYKKANQLFAEKHIDCCVVVYKQIEAVLAGLLLKRKYPKMKLVVYFLDAMSGSKIPRVLRSDTIAICSVKQWERKVFEQADSIFIMESHKSYYFTEEFAKYHNKFKVLDIPLLDMKLFDKSRESISNDRINMVYTGSMTLNTANPYYLLEMLEQMGTDRYVINIYGSIAPEIQKIIEHSSFYGVSVFTHGKIPHQQVRKVQQEADVFLNFGNDNPCMIPCKIFEYMSTGKKILSFTYSDSDSSLPYMKQYGNALIIEQNERIIKKNITELSKFMQKIECVEMDLESLKQRFYKNTPEYFADTINDLIEG